MAGTFHENAILTMEALYEAPTQTGWEAAILHALRGDLDFQIQRVGDISDFFQSNLRTNPDPVRAELEFRRALEAIVFQWELGAPRTFFYVDGMLRLIRKFLPPSGPRKILGRLNRSFSYFCVPAALEEEQRNLLDFSFMALEAYFPAPVGRSDEIQLAEYKSYIGILRGIAGGNGANREYFMGYACRRLIELRDWEITDPTTVAYIWCHYREILRELLSWILSSEWYDRAKLLSILYRFSSSDFEDVRGPSIPLPNADRLDDPRSEDFRRTLELFGGRLDERTKPSLVYDASGGAPLVLVLDKEADDAYLKSLSLLNQKSSSALTQYVRDTYGVSGTSAQEAAMKEGGA
jgi:hypothetical protein